MENKRIYGFMYALLAAVFWASFYIISRIVFGKYELNVGPLVFSFYRFIFAFIFFVVLITASGQTKKTITALKEDTRGFVLLGLTGVFGQGVLIFLALKYTTATRSSLCANMTPVFTLIFAFLILKEKVTIKNTVGVFLGLAGITLAITTNTGSDQYLNSTSILGDLLAILSGVCWALYTVIGVNIIKKHGALLTTALSLFFGALLCLAYLLIQGKSIFVHTSPAIWLAMVYLGVISNGLGFGSWFMALKYLKATELSSFNYVVVFVTLVLSVVFLGEKLDLTFWPGIIIVIIGMSLMINRNSNENVDRKDKVPQKNCEI